MNVVKKYACHRLYGAGKIYLTQSVVSLDEEGKVKDVSPLSEEIAATEWLGGIIILSHRTVLTPERDFQALFHQLTDSVTPPVYAWHISDFDFKEEKLTPQSRIRRL